MVAEELVNADKGGVLTLVAPSVAAILALYLLQASSINGRPEPTHKSTVKVEVVLVTRLVDEVRVSIDQPGLVCGRGCAGELEDETIFPCSVSRSVD